MAIQLLIFVLSAGLLQGLMLLVIFLMRRRLEKFHLFISLYVVVLLLQMFFKLASKSWLYHFMQPSYLVSYYLPLLYGPLIFLFSLYYTNPNAKWRASHVLHFVPFAIFLFAYAFPIDGRQLPAPALFVLGNLGRFWLSTISIMLYHIAALDLGKRALPNAAHVMKLRAQFVRSFSLFSMFIGWTISFALYYLYSAFPMNQDLRWTFALLSFFIYWISYKLMQQPGLFKVIMGNEQALTIELPLQTMKVHYPKEKYAHSGLKDEEAHRILALLKKIMAEEKPYLDPDYKLDQLVNRLDCQKHHLSQVFNHHLRIGFSDYMNLKRIEAAKIILLDPSFSHWKVATVAYETGFNNISTFNDSFKKREGVTPSQFRQRQQGENQSRIQRG